MNTRNRLMIPQDSPKIHPGGVKLGKGGKGRKIKENNYSLFMFHLFTPTHPRDARPRVNTRVRVRGGEKVNLENGRPGACPERGYGWLRPSATTCRSSMVPPWPKTRRDAAGNSLALFDSLFCKSGIYLRGPHSRTTVRASCRPGELPDPRHGWRPGATWRGRGAASRRIGMDFVAAPGTAGLANARRGKARDEGQRGKGLKHG